MARATVFGLWGLIVLWTPLDRLPQLPGIFSPPGLLAAVPDGLWEWFAGPLVLAAFRWGLVIVLFVAASLRKPSGVLLLAAAGGTLLFHGFILGHGAFLNHGRFGLLYVGIALALVGTPREDIGDPVEPSVAGAALRLLALLVAVAYALIGLQRLFVGGWSIFTNDALPTYLMLRTFETGGFDFEVSYLLVGSTLAVAGMKLGFFVTTLAEVASPFAVFHRRFRTAWLLVIVPFHFVTLLTMNIFFWENLVLIGLLFTDLPSRVERVWSVRSSGR